MNTKAIVTISLLVFVAGSIIAIAINGKGGSQPANAPETVSEPYTGVVAYYFHKTKRCETCQKIESYAKEVITGNFVALIEKGDLRWETQNIELPENQHFVDDYQLLANALVLVRYENGKQTEFRNLDQIWNLVGDQNEFKAYVQGSLAAFIAPTS